MMSVRIKIKKGDTVYVLAGRDKGKKGTVIAVMPDVRKVVIEKLNVVKKHQKPTQNLPHGGIQDIELPLPVSRVMLVCPMCGKTTRVGRTLAGDGKYVRICRKCHQSIDSKA